MLGDTISTALQSVGVTSDRVERWLGKPCGCDDRRQQINAIEFWARRVIIGKVERAKELLQKLLSSDEG